MKEFQDKRKLRRVLHSVPFLVLLFAATVFFTISGIRLYGRHRIAYSKNKEIKADLAEIEARKEDVEAGVARLKSQAGIDEEIRSKLSMGKPGEKIMVIVDKKDKNNKVETTDESGFFSDLWGKVKGMF